MTPRAAARRMAALRRQALLQAGVAMPDEPQHSRAQQRSPVCMTCGSAPALRGRRVCGECAAYLDGVARRDAGNVVAGG
jgi:hypothetical protein